MLLLSLLIATHVPTDMYLSCEDYDWLAQGLMESKLFTPSQTVEILQRWITHTDPHCFSIEA